MIERENNPARFLDPLYEEIPGPTPQYVHIPTGKIYDNHPGFTLDERGGILCENMVSHLLNLRISIVKKFMCKIIERNILNELSI